MAYIINLNDTNPAAPTGKANVKWQKGATPADPSQGVPVSAYVDPPPALKVNGTPNGSQSTLNLKAGSNIGLTDDGVGGVTITASAGSGGSFLSPDSHSATPTAYDDDFEAASLDTSWTAIYNATDLTSFSTYMQGWLMVRYSGNNTGGNAGLVIGKSFTPGSADFSVTLKGMCNGRNAYDTLTLQLSDTLADSEIGTSTVPNSNCLTYGYTNAAYSLRGDRRVSGVQTQGTNISLNNGNPPRIMYLHFQRVSGTWTGWYSMDGVYYEPYTGNTWNTTLSVAYLIIGVRRYGTVDTTSNRAGFDWVRVNQLFLA